MAIHWWKLAGWLVRRAGKGSRGGPRRFQPHLEQLEDRCVPAFVTADPVNHLLTLDTSSLPAASTVTLKEFEFSQLNRGIEVDWQDETGSHTDFVATPPAGYYDTITTDGLPTAGGGTIDVLNPFAEASVPDTGGKLNLGGTSTGSSSYTVNVQASSGLTINDLAGGSTIDITGDGPAFAVVINGNNSTLQGPDVTDSVGANWCVNGPARGIPA